MIGMSTSDDKIKLCLIIPSLQAGGMERVMSELAWYFASKINLELYLVLYGRNRDIFYPLPKKIIVYRPSFLFNNRYRLIHTLRTLYFLRAIVKKIHPDSILSFGELWNSLVLIATTGLKYPVFISDRCSPERNYSLLNRLLRGVLYPKAKGIIAQTETAKSVYYSQFKHKNIKVIGNPIREINNDNELEKENIVLMVGRLINTKNQDKLIETFLNIKILGWKLILVGHDHLKQNNSVRLQEIINSHKAEHKVILEGKQPNVENYYNKSKIFAFTSSSEGFPNAIGEAMSAGLPVIAFDCVAGPSEMINDNHNGFLIPLFDYERFQEKLEWLMNHEETRIKFGVNASEDIKTFSLNRIAEEYIQFLIN